MFDELHDPEPLDVGLHQFAIVAERARAIRRRRARVGVRVASVGVVALGAAAIWTAMPGTGGDPVQLEPLPPVVTTVPTHTPTTIGRASATTVPTTVPEARPTADVDVVPLGQAAMLRSLPQIELTAPVVVDVGGRTVEIDQDESGRVCIRAGDAEVGCSEPDVRLYAVQVDAPVPVDDAESDVAPLRVVLVVDDDVRLNFLTVGASCAPKNIVGGSAPVRVWVCEGLDVDRATVQDRGSGVVVIATTPER